MHIGYARVSSDGQSVAIQVEQLKAAGCERIFAENVSGVVTDRKELARAMKALQPGDVLIVTKLDRLARSLRDLLNTLSAIADKAAGFRVLDNAALDTTNAYGALLLNVLGALAQFERELIRSRTAEGRQRARAEGVRFGRPPALTPHQLRLVTVRRANGESCAEIAADLNVSHSTVSRATRGHE
jgi:DNA invertase Pin-like site-specific DNA recombinase